MKCWTHLRSGTGGPGTHWRTALAEGVAGQFRISMASATYSRTLDLSSIPLLQFSSFDISAITFYFEKISPKQLKSSFCFSSSCLIDDKFLLRFPFSFPFPFHFDNKLLKVKDNAIYYWHMKDKKKTQSHADRIILQ